MRTKHFTCFLFFFFPLTIFSQTIWQPIDSTLSFDTGYSGKFDFDFDFNQDGVADFTLEYANNIVLKVHIGSDNESELVCPAYFDLTVFDSLDIIGPSTNGWYNSTGIQDPWGFFEFPRIAYKFYSGGDVSGNFATLLRKNIGVRFTDEGNLHYGYITISCDYSVMPLHAITIHGYGYNMVPGEAVIAGTGSVVTSVIEANRNNNQIKIYPNPVQDILNIDSEEIIKTISIYNNLGALIYQKTTLNQLEQNIDLANFSKGFYSILIETEHHVYSQRIIKIE